MLEIYKEAVEARIAVYVDVYTESCDKKSSHVVLWFA